MVVGNNTLHIHHHFIHSLSYFILISFLFILIVFPYLSPTPFVFLVATITLTHARSRALRSLTYTSLSLADTISIHITIKHHHSPSFNTIIQHHMVTFAYAFMTYLLVAQRSRAATHTSHCVPYRSSIMPPHKHFIQSSNVYSNGVTNLAWRTAAYISMPFRHGHQHQAHRQSWHHMFMLTAAPRHTIIIIYRHSQRHYMYAATGMHTQPSHVAQHHITPHPRSLMQTGCVCFITTRARTLALQSTYSRNQHIRQTGG
jgi:hypothetical protein